MGTNTSIPIEEKIFLRVPRARVWRALTSADEFGDWFGVKLAGEFAPGASVKGKKTREGHEGKPFGLVVERMEPPALFSWHWHPYAVDPGVGDSTVPLTHVVFELEEGPSGTLLSVCETGFEAIPAARRAAAYRMHEEGWAEQLKSIQRYLAEAA